MDAEENMKFFRHFTIVTCVVFGSLTYAATAISFENNFSHAVQKISPAVVEIEVLTNIPLGGEGATPQRRQDMLPPDSPLRKLFPKEETTPSPQAQQFATVVGSGFIIDKTGLIVTNFHVIENHQKVWIVFNETDRIPAQVVVGDKKNDIALLKVDFEKPLQDLHVAEFADSDTVTAGSWALVVGNPLGIGKSVSIGLVSAKDRINQDTFINYLQTDAAMNRGNSGGPLVNAEGKVIGMNTFISSLTGGSIGIGFSIPSNVIQHVVSELREHGRVRRARLGMNIADITETSPPELAPYKGRGVLVAAVAPNQPADRAGIKMGDVITSFNEKKISRVLELKSRILFTKVGTTVRFTVMRNGEAKTITMALEEAPQTRN